MFQPKNQANLRQKGQKRGALNPNSIFCTNQAPAPGFCALNPGSALNPRTLNPGTIVLTGILPPVIAYCVSYE